MQTNLSGKTALIVDSSLEDLDTLRQVLKSLGFAQVQAASSVNMALTLMREFSYDICFASYAMGRNEKNGLQLLHEANEEQLLSYTGTFCLIVDPDSSELLFGSLENSPDTYISKPFSQAKVQHRLDKELRIKSTIKPIEEALDANSYERALALCDEFIDSFPGLSIYLQRLKGITLLKLAHYDQAMTLFQEMIARRDLPWAEVGKGIASYHLGKYDVTLHSLNRVVDQQHLCVEAFSWLARVYRAKGELERAVTLMRKAVMLQPTVPALQAELADLASQTGEWEIAKNGYQQAVRYARYSAFQTPDYYLGSVQALLQSNRSKLSEVEHDVIKTLEYMVLDHPDDHVVRFRAKLIHCEYYRLAQDQVRLEQMLQQTWNFFLRMAIEKQCEWLDVMTEAVERSLLTAEVEEKRKSLNQQIVHLPWGKNNYKGMVSFRKGDVESAFQFFSEVHRSLEGHSGVALNLVQAAIELAKRDGDRALTCLHYAQEVLAKIHFAALPHKQQERFQALYERCIEQYNEMFYEDDDALGDILSQDL